MVEKKGLKSPRKTILTKAEKEVLHLITDEFLTIKQISQRRQTSLQAVYKIIKKIKKKGSFDVGLKRVEKIEPTFNQTDIRLHGQEFNIKILWQDNKYQKALNKSNTIFLDSNTIRLYKNSIEVYSGQSFYGKTTNEADKKGFEYWERFFSRLEHDLNIIIKKQRSRNIKEVNHHYARGDSEIQENATKNKERIWIYAAEDGKLAFITDDSFGFKEDECVHPITAKKDREAIDKQINDWRKSNPPTNSELATHIGNVTGNQEIFDKNMQSHLKILNKLGKAVEQLTTAVKRKNVREKLNEEQKTLVEY